MDKVVVRSVRSEGANHNTSLVLSGYHATVGGTALKGINPDWPFFMSAIHHVPEREGQLPAGPLPPHMCVPNRLGLLEGYNRA